MLYQSEAFIINYREKDKLILPKWTGVPLSASDFMTEMKTYMRLLERTQAEGVIWDHTNFHFQIPEKLFQWIEDYVNRPAKEMGAKRIGFILGEDVMAQFTTMESFETTNSVFTPCYFADPKKAMSWATKKEKMDTNPFEKEIGLYLEKKLDAGTANIKIEVSLEQLPYYMKKIKELFTDQEFVHKNYGKYLLLTRREREILALVMQGHSTKAIAEQLFLSTHTINTHRSNMMTKLDCKNMAELMKFKLFI